MRLIAATNVGLHDAVSAGHFRADLYYRLSVATLELRPLCERPGDILPLARHFLAVYAARLGIAHPVLAADAQQALLAYSWPGNIRELENIIHYALIVAPSTLVRAEDLQLLRRGPAAQLQRAAAAGVTGVAAQQVVAAAAPSPAPGLAPVEDDLARVVARWLERDEPDAFERFEAAFLTAAFEQCDSNQVHTARALGLSRNVLRTLLKRHGLLQLKQHANTDESAAGLRC